MKIYLLILSIVIVDGEIFKEHVHSNIHFSVDFVKEMANHNRTNYVFSPLSIEMILKLIHLGANGDAANEIQKVTHLPQSKDTVKNLAKAFFTDFNEVKGPKLVLANKVYLAKGIHIKPEFIKTAKEVFGAEVENIDFTKNVQATDQINSWVEKETLNRIKKIIDDDQINEHTKMILVNTLYFKGQFKYPFNAADTVKKDFHLVNNQTIQVDTMKLTHCLPIHENKEEKVTVIQIPYVSNKGNLRLTLGLPHVGLKKLLGGLKEAAEKQMGNYSQKCATIFLPKFSIESFIDIKSVIKNMGITKLFSSPDLSGITDDKIEINEINHKLFLDVNEQGTDVSAADAAVENQKNQPAEGSEPVEYHFNSPFIFCIMYDELNLMTGIVMDPSKK